MPSPFPGMDPYLENPGLWPGVHGRLIPAIAAALNQILPANYVADIDERVYIAEPDRRPRPDVAILEIASTPPVIAVERSRVLVTDAPVRLPIGEEVREGFVRIIAFGTDTERDKQTRY